jgi:drug/metabolite transporter (DMT)-like permease
MKSKVKELFMYVLGALIVLGTFVLIAMLVLVILKHPESPLKDTLVLAIGALLAAFGGVVNYFYGSSKGSADKSEAINEKMNG